MQRSLAMITSLLEAAYLHKDVPTETRHCLDQLAAEVNGLNDAFAKVAAVQATPADTGIRSRPSHPRRRRTDTLYLTGIGDLPSRSAGDGNAALCKLTAQERRILQFIAAGCTNRQIAGELFLAEKTVKNYVSNMLRKLGMERRTQAAVYAARLDEALTGGSARRSA
ncbi:MAG: response regulator transcription factor [Acidimicrobiales bacterium]